MMANPATSTCDEGWAEIAQLNRHRVEITHTCTKLAGHHASADLATHRCACGQTKRAVPTLSPSKERVTA